MMAPPATKDFLCGTATTIQKRAVISSGANCNVCHTEIAAHGFGRRRQETCPLCHNAPSVEDGPKYTYAAWYVRPTPGVTMDFPSTRAPHPRWQGADEAPRGQRRVPRYAVRITYDTVGFPSFGGGVSECTKCHGANSTAWQEPMVAEHPLSLKPKRNWAELCSSCHDSSAAEAHFFVQTNNGSESCGVCHGKDKEYAVKVAHKVR